MKIQILIEVLDGLMEKYVQRVPDVKKILNAMKRENVISKDTDIENDHVAFRTLGVPRLGIKSLEKIFLFYGYKKMSYYYFPEKKLNAYWYSPPLYHFPRIFISELRVGDLSKTAQDIIYSYTNDIKSDPVDSLDLYNSKAVDSFLHTSLWRLPTLSDYLTLSNESEYAAWTIYNRYYLNHYTISVHNLKPGYNTIYEFVDFLERNGLILNNSGGKIKISPDGGLLQSSTVAQLIEATFANGERYTIAGSYVEFAERKVLPEYAHLPSHLIKRHHRRDGFEAANADKIFESTYKSQTG
jgi:hypothetical protein